MSTIITFLSPYDPSGNGIPITFTHPGRVDITLATVAARRCPAIAPGLSAREIAAATGEGVAAD